jgi:hypothetical protein
MENEMRKTLAILITAASVAAPQAHANGLEQALIVAGIFGAGYAVAQSRSPYPQGVPPVYVNQQGYPQQVMPQQPVVVYNNPIYIPPQRCFQPFYDRFGQYLGSRAVSCY